MNKKTKIIYFTKDTLGIRDDENITVEDFDMDETVYDMQVKRIFSGTIAILTDRKSSSGSLIMIDNDFYWVESETFILLDSS